MNDKVSDERLAELIDYLVRFGKHPWHSQQHEVAGGPSCRSCDTVAALRELQALRAQGEDAWRPIEGAPKDGSRILLAANVHDPSGRLRISVGRYTDEPYWTPATGTIGAESGFQCDGDDCIPSNQEAFTHWMPLPPAPREKP